MFEERRCKEARLSNTFQRTFDMQHLSVKRSKDVLDKGWLRSCRLESRGFAFCPTL